MNQTTEQPATAPSPFATHRWTRAEYEHAVAAGVFHEDSHIELLDGQLVERLVTQYPPHAWMIQRLSAAFVRHFGEQVRVQLPLALSDSDEPEPDLAVVPPGDYRHAHPTTAALIIEVSDTTVRHDRTTKALVYARAAVPVYCLVNLPAGHVEVHTGPRADGYQSVETVRPNQEMPPRASLAEWAWSVATIVELLAEESSR